MSEPTGKNPRLIYRLNAARHCLMKSLDAQCRKELDISVIQLTALMVLGKQNRCRMKDLAATLMLDKSAVTGLAKRMEAGGLITKSRGTEDSRATYLEITERGKEKLAQGKPYLKTINARLTQGFTDEEIKTVTRFLDQITQNFSV
ncbi:MarR family winged helix-turn-helix transcriptional regulator [Acanthopleuribacter pedis]|uniref:MarR family transcriptional regulator n=1 Tax=Acanthopleuribacter pedis TaxID=442870 RepID=A0A8J7QG72_9BACT|nr:MarR family transcriptional regulator [Acanthopleuribacter pedis]MBO1319781.1 MarR family transcriptional regulator [Acanthopleuribacter pedis]